MPDLLPDSTRRWIAATILRHLPAKPDIKILLFGSFANGNAGPASDIDVAILGSGPLDLVTWSNIEEDFAQSDLARKIDLVDYHRVTDAFKQLIDRTGQPLTPHP